MAIDNNETNKNHRPVSKTAQHGFDESPTIPAPLSPSLYCGAQVCGQEYCIRIPQIGIFDRFYAKK